MLLFVACHTKFLFLDAHVESGDFAANALQIRNAKFFQEIWGNYSRFGFHHPGPAFFYAYAAGEWLFHDLTRLVPSPFNAHVLAGIIVQCGFFAWALCIVRSRAPHPLIIPLLLALGALHFGTVNAFIPDSAFTSIWPPNVLLMPFVCFLVACASLASAGAGRDLVAAAVAGSFLVHGHVAQPLFVGPCFVLAVVIFLKRSASTEGSVRAALKRAQPFGLTAIGIIVVALVPIALDAAAGPNSNLATILRHFRTHASDHKTLQASLTYFFSFFCYIGNPEAYCDQITANSLHFLRDRWQFVASWLGIIGTLTFLSRRSFLRKPFVLWLCVYLGAGVVLTLGWGMLQDGSMLYFNAFFNYGLIFLLLVILALGLCDWLPRHIGRSVSVGSALGGLLLFIPCTRGLHFNSDLPTFAFAPALSTELEGAARSDRTQAKILLFPQVDWPHAVGVALALRRLDYDYVVPPEWEFMFGRRHSHRFLDSFASERVSVWRFGNSSRLVEGFALNSGAFVVTGRPPINPIGDEIRFAGNDVNAPDYLLAESGPPNDRVVQIEGLLTALEFRPIRTALDVQIAITLSSDNPSPTSAGREMTVSFNRHEIGRMPLAAGSTLNTRVSRELWNRGGPARMLF